MCSKQTVYDTYLTYTSVIRVNEFIGIWSPFDDEGRIASIPCMRARVHTFFCPRTKTPTMRATTAETCVDPRLFKCDDKGRHMGGIYTGNNTECKYDKGTTIDTERCA